MGVLINFKEFKFRSVYVIAHVFLPYGALIDFWYCARKLLAAQRSEAGIKERMGNVPVNLY